MAGPDQSRPVPYGGVPDPNQPGQAVSYPAGQYPPAAGQYPPAVGQYPPAPNSSPAYGYSSAYGSSRPPRRRHTGIIALVVVLVAVRVLVVITVVGILMWFWAKSDRHEVGASASAGTNVADSGDRWSSDWLNGAEGVDKGEANPRALSDGWIVYAGRQSHAVNLYEADGSTRETFESGVDDRFTTYPWTPVPVTLDQARLWFKDGDVSWAPSTYSVSQADASCNSITVGDNDIDLGKDNSLTDGKEGHCYGTSPIQAVYHSGDGQIALGDGASYSVQGDMLIAYDRAGNATAYRPA